MCVCTGNASLISRQIKSSILHLPCLLMETKRSSDLLGACFWSLYVSGFQFGGVRGVKLIFIEYLLCARQMVGCLALIITFLKQLCEVGLLIPHSEDKKLSLRKAQLILPRF